jgi:hypothetical protein
MKEKESREWKVLGGKKNLLMRSLEIYKKA